MATKLYYNGDYALEREEEGFDDLWTIKAIGRMVGQTPVVFTVQIPNSSGPHGGYNRMILAKCMNDLSEHFSLGFSWRIFNSDNVEVDKSLFEEFALYRRFF